MQGAEKATSGEAGDLAGKESVGGRSGTEGVSCDCPAVVMAALKVGENLGGWDRLGWDGSRRCVLRVCRMGKGSR